MTEFVWCVWNFNHDSCQLDCPLSQPLIILEAFHDVSPSSGFGSIPSFVLKSIPTNGWPGLGPPSHSIVNIQFALFVSCKCNLDIGPVVPIPLLPEPFQ